MITSVDFKHILLGDTNRIYEESLLKHCLISLAT